MSEKYAVMMLQDYYFLRTLNLHASSAGIKLKRHCIQQQLVKFDIKF